jgi:hypothetical protein
MQIQTWGKSGEQVMSKMFKAYAKASAVVLFGLGAVTFATSASACGDEALQHAASWQGGQANGLFHQAQIDAGNIHSIVGLWSFKMTSGGQIVDFGYQEWHSDGTEILNSGSRAPASGDFCMGAWTQTAPSRFHLNHYPLVVDNNGVLQARVVLKMDVTVDPSGMTFSGTFTQDVYNAAGTAKIAPTLTGPVTATRVSGK